MKISNFKQAAEYQLCCGCGLCAYLNPEKIKMVDCLNYGKRPQFILNTEESSEIGIGMCPGLNLDRNIIQISRKECIESFYDEWGPIVNIYEGHSTDNEIRFKGSSGGAITALALYCLEKKKFTGVLHVVANKDKPALNATKLSRNREAILYGAGSRYSPASPCEELKQVEEAKNPCVVIGKPCDIAATAGAAKEKIKLREKVGLTIACFCAGTPSTKGTIAMLENMGVSQEKLATLRYRGNGWPGLAYAKEREQNAPARELTYEQSWGDILQKYRQWRCYICPDHTGEFADIAVGDPWYKDIEEGDIGQSLILVRSHRGAEIFENAIAAGYLKAEPVSPDILPRSQPNLKKTRASLWGRLLALKMMNAPYPEYNNFGLFASWKNDLAINEKFRSVLSTVKRITVKKLRKKRDLFLF